MTGTVEASARVASPHIHAKDPAACAGVDGSYPLLCHLVDTAIVSRILWETRLPTRLRSRLDRVASSHGLDTGAVRLAMLAGALHDVGKANPFFQYQERAPQPWALDLAATLDLPATDAALAASLRGDAQHPLRRHEFISHRITAGRWADDADQVAGPGWFATLVGGHHGHWRPTTRPGGVPVDVAGDLLIAGWPEEHDLIVAAAEHAARLRLADLPSLDDRDGVVAFTALSGLLTLADWLASDDSQVETGKRLYEACPHPYASPGFIDWWIRERDAAWRVHVDERLGAAGSASTASWNDAVLTDRASGTRFDPRPLQAEAMAGVRAGGDAGLWVVMYPTGDGKTEAAALRHALRPDEGMIFGLPTRATTDAMERRLGPWLDDAGAHLAKAHMFSGLDDQPRNAPGCSTDCSTNPDWYTTSIRKLVSPNLVATCDQVLSGALAQRHLTFRLLGLAAHHVILDEVHTYDVYQTALLLELLTWWGATGTRVTLLSATLPTSHLREMARAYRSGATGEPAETITVPDTTFPGTLFVPADPGGDLSAVSADPDLVARKPQPTVFALTSAIDRTERADAHVAWVRDTLTQHPASPLAVVANTIGDCSYIAQNLTGTLPGHDVICLHSAMVSGHRSATEQILHRGLGKKAHARGFDPNDPDRRPVVVVGTQVIQASLDFDVDFMSTDLCPAPDVIQRLGRQWRFEAAATATGERALRLGAGANRLMHVVSVGEPADGSPGDPLRITSRGAVPYLPSVLQRTHSWLAERPEVTGRAPLDVFTCSQSWVDAAYDRDPHAILDEQHAKDEMREVVDKWAMLRAADASRADLHKVLLNGKRRGTWRSPTWADLALLTSRNEDEALMRTRYIETETLTVLLFDSTGRSHYVDESGTPVSLPPYNGASLADVPPSRAARLLTWAVPVPSSLRKAAEAAVAATLGIGDGDWRDAWAPRAKALGSIPPLDLAHLDGTARYSPLTGLTKEI